MSSHCNAANRLPVNLGCVEINGSQSMSNWVRLTGSPSSATTSGLSTSLSTPVDCVPPLEHTFTCHEALHVSLTLCRCPNFVAELAISSSDAACWLDLGWTLLPHDML